MHHSLCSQFRPNTPLRSFDLVLCVLALLAGIATAAKGTVLLPPGSDWRFEDSGTDLGSTWRDASYDDSAWSAGPGILGYGESYIVTPVSFGGDSSDKHPTTYFRTGFDIPGDPTDLVTLTLLANYDDAFVAYLNGVEVARRNLPGGTITYATPALGGHEGGSYESVDMGSGLPLLVSGTNVLAVEVHQVNATSSDLVWDGEVRATEIGTILVSRGPYLQIGTPTSVRVRWRTDVPASSRVRYGTTLEALVLESSLSGSRTEHELELTGLSPATRYYYAVGTTEEDLAGGDPSHSFRTLPLSGAVEPVRVWAIGDCGEANQGARDVRDAYLQWRNGEDTDVWLMLGDNAYSTGSDVEYQAAIFDTYPGVLRNTLLWSTRGNHDEIHAGSNNDYYEIFSLPAAGEAGGLPSGTEAYYSFDYANVHFVCLDSDGTDRSSGGPMLTWLSQDLAATTQDWIIAFWHHPPYSKGSHDSDTESHLIEMRENALPILEANGVDLVLSGHSHSYERSFLIDGHYDVSSTLQPSMILDDGDGSTNGDGAYAKDTPGLAPYEGTVYAVPGSSSKLSNGPLDHPIMVRSLSVLGSLALDIHGHRLDGVFVDDLGAEQDGFTILKGLSVADVETEDGNDGEDGVDGPSIGDRPDSIPVATYPNPATNSVTFSTGSPRNESVALTVYDSAGRVVRRIEDSASSARELEWDLKSDRGARVAPGLYYAVVRSGDSVTSRKIVVGH